MKTFSFLAYRTRSIGGYNYAFLLLIMFYLSLGKSNNTWLYMGIGGVILLLLLTSICACCFLCYKKKAGRRTRSFDSAESGMSQN